MDFLLTANLTCIHEEQVSAKTNKGNDRPCRL